MNKLQKVIRQLSYMPISNIAQKLIDLETMVNEKEVTLIKIREWLDNNTTHYETAESDEPVLACVSKKIWYHATDDIDSYPFTDMMDKSIKEYE